MSRRTPTDDSRDSFAVTLRPMSEAEFEIFLEESCSDYARESPHYRHLPYSSARPLVDVEFRTRLLPSGLRTPGHHLFTLLSGETPIGAIHLGESSTDDQASFVWNFKLREAHRGKHLAEPALREAIAYSEKIGRGRIGLNVFSTNAAAIHLYRKIGFVVTQFNMTYERSPLAKD